ncbi:SHOCT domain-containing protein [Senegalia massiliensis]|uniref:SHOCT domain-containing protein n=1 Tax=Senegalia massiliensis TaxID=1720316 RepID=UPI0010314C1A|nr:SHOCT domain-containing protein [Senegalia massiliensis]
MYYGFQEMLSNMLIVWLIPIVLLLIIGISLFMIRKNNKKNSKESNSSALEILNERYAKGEIDEEEYNRKKNNLNHLK